MFSSHRASFAVISGKSFFIHMLILDLRAIVLSTSLMRACNECFIMEIL